MISIRRVYDLGKPEEQYKVLVDRLWPRGLSKEKADWDEWVKEIAPSEELRKWFNHDPAKWDQFAEQYKKELAHKQNELKRLKHLEKEFGTLTLLYAAKDKEHNNAVVLLKLLKT